MNVNLIYAIIAWAGAVASFVCMLRAARAYAKVRSITRRW